MLGAIVTIAVGIICIALGISNTKGNISSLHSYHRSRVKEEDVLPFGRLVGLGTIIVGSGIALYGGLMAISLLLEKEIFVTIGSGVMIVGIIAGLAVAFYAMKKYNGGIM